MPKSDQPLFHWGLSQREPRRPGLIKVAIRDFLRKFNETNILESKIVKEQNHKTQETDSVLLNQGPDWHPHPHLEELSVGGEELRMYSLATTKQQRQKLSSMKTTGATFIYHFRPDLKFRQWENSKIKCQEKLCLLGYTTDGRLSWLLSGAHKIR